MLVIAIDAQSLNVGQKLNCTAIDKQKVFKWRGPHIYKGVPIFTVNMGTRVPKTGGPHTGFQSTNRMWVGESEYQSGLNARSHEINPNYEPDQNPRVNRALVI